MKCPYRKIIEKAIKKESKPFPKNSTVRITELEEFPECQYAECPFYKISNDKAVCSRAIKEMGLLIKADKEEKRLSIWAN